MRTSSDVHNYLEERGVPHEMLPMPDTSASAERAAQLLGVRLGEIVKSMVFMVDGVPELVLVPGDARVAAQSLAGATGARKVALARAQEVLAATGYRVGAVPPCGLASALPVVADPRVFDPPVVYCGGGAAATMLKIRSADLRTVVDPLVADVAER